MRKSNLTYEQLIELAPKDRPFQMEVESNPDGEGGRQVLWANIYHTILSTNLLNQDNVFGIHWKCTYKGKFTLIDEYRNMYEKPEVLEVGTEVEILESAKDCGSYDDWTSKHKSLVGTIQTITDVYDGNAGIFYTLPEVVSFPHYCVRPVEKKDKPEEEIITVNGKKYKLINH